MLNETQKVSPAKTKSARNPRLLAILGVSLFAAIVVFFVFASPKQNDTGPSVKINDTTFTVQIADTDDERIQGLSGSSALPERTGMLFMFPEPAQQCIWMKDMNYSIDILWMDSNGRVTDIRRQVTPDTYPDQFCSSDATTYVLELPAGSVGAHSISVGDSATIQP